MGWVPSAESTGARSSVVSVVEGEPHGRKDDRMGKVIVMNWVTLDGVMQAPGRADEDTRNGFACHADPHRSHRRLLRTTQQSQVLLI
jgi:hypothetical protein